jgi:hypothetical protein
VLVALSIAATAAAAGNGSEAESPQLVPPLTDAMRAQVADAETQYRAAKARRATPEARQARVRSRAAYRGLGRAAALALGVRELSEVFDRPAFRPLELPARAHVDRLVGTSAALIEVDGERQLVESIGVPLTSTVASGDREFVDLSLRGVNGDFVPRNPVVPLRITGRGTALLPGSDTAVALDGTEPTGEPVDVNGRVFLAGALTDTDLVMAPTLGGVSFAFQVRSASAPEQAILSFDLPAGATLRLGAGDSAGEVEIVGPAGNVRARVLAPSGWDADGEPLDVSYALDGSRLLVNFPHRARDLHYPLYVDPIYHDDGYFPSSVGWPEWTFTSNGNSWSTSLGNPMKLANYYAGGPSYSANQYAAYYLRSLRGYVSKLEGSYVSHNTPQSTCAYMGILTTGWAAWKGLWSNCGAVTNAFPIVTTSNTGYDDTAMFQFKATVTGRRWAEASLTAYGARVWLDDNEYPTVTGVTNSTNGAWVGAGQQVTINPRAQDAGLGVKVFNLYAAGTPNSWIRPNGVATTDYGQGCTGVRGARCPQWEVTGSISINTNDLKDANGAFLQGDLTLGGQAFDALSKASNYYTNVKVDRSGPSIGLSGSLWDARGSEIHSPSYSLQATPTDPYSGVRNVDILLDGTSVVPAGAPESAARSWTLQPGTCIVPGAPQPCAKYGSGLHRIRVVASDRVGNVASTEFKVTWLP